jgi:RNA polymerase sigma-70 factor (ECF subfamily)
MGMKKEINEETKDVVENTEVFNYKSLIEACIDENSEAQEELYKQFAPKLFGICLRYMKNQQQAEDLLQEVFLKIYASLDTFKYKGSFEGWMRKITVNLAINFYKKEIQNIINQKGIPVENVRGLSDNAFVDVISKMSEEYLLSMIQKLPVGYRTVFNLHVIEGYTHKKIGELLGISPSTSKTQFMRARNSLQRQLVEY